MTEPVTIYGMIQSQPTRAVMWLCKIKNLPYNVVKVSPGGSRKKNPRKDFIANINPMGRIPGLKDSNGFTIYESAAILCYLSEKYEWEDLYPTKNNLQRRALIQQYLNWHHENVRKVTTGYIVYLLRSDVDPKKWNVESIKTERKLAGFGLKVIENIWLSAHDYIIDNKLSIADILCYEELVQLRWWNLIDDFGAKFPNINKWLDRMQKVPCHDETHQILDRMKGYIAQRQSKNEFLTAK
eukprot:UN08681